MCSIGLIRTFSKLIVLMRACTSLFFFGEGVALMGNLGLAHGYGSGIPAIGFMMLLFGILSFLITFPWSYAVRRHNRFLLIVCCGVDIGISVVMFSLAGGLKGFGTPLFDKSLQTDCLKNQPVKYTPAQCTAYFTSPQTAGYRMYWAGYFSDQTAENVALVSVSIEEPGACCGFFAPGNAIGHSFILRNPSID